MSENIKAVVEYGVELAGLEEKVVEIDGKDYYDANRYRMVELEPKRYPACLELRTLASLVDYLKSDLNGINQERVMVVVENPTEVSVYSQNDERSVRTRLVNVQALTPSIHYAEWEEASDFNVLLQSKFQDRDDRWAVLEFASALRIENAADIKDDGVSQVTTIKDGVASVAKAKAPNPVTLRPYRTFAEVEQPASQFIFRVNKRAEMALFEADGSAWRLEAVNNIATYLKEALAGQDNITILA